MAGMGEICGALTGGVVALGLRFGRGHPSEREDRRLFLRGQELHAWFASLEDHKPSGTVLCREIAKTDFRDPKQLQAFFGSGRAEQCMKLIGKTAPQVANMLRREA